MKYLIAHSSILHQTRIRQSIKRLNSDAQFLTATALTDTYHLAEHHVPNCVIIAEELTHCEEFELVVSLFSIMGIACIVMKTTSLSSSRHPVFQQFLQVSEPDLVSALKSVSVSPKPTRFPSTHKNCSHSASPFYDPKRIVLIGASTGGIDALLTVTKTFDDASPPILIVQHTGGQFAKSLVRLLDGACRASVLAATDGMGLTPGNIYLAPDDQNHMVLSEGPTPQICLDHSPTVSGHRPSIDALFTSAVHLAPHISAALLTGMGKDGAVGMTSLRARGAHTIGQDKETSVVYGMPRVAMEMGGVCKQLPLKDIGPALLHSCKRRVRA